VAADAGPLPPTRFGAFIAPFHDPRGNPTLQLHRDLELVEHLDRLGYDEVWLGEHHSGAYEISASPEVMIAAASERTRRIRLGTGVNSLPYHNPYILADRIVQLDHLSMGRVMLGMGPGQLPTDAFMMGIDPREQRDMMYEAAEVIVPLLRGETVSHKADWFRLEDARLQLLPFNPDGIEVGVASTFSPAGATLAGQLGLSLLSVAATDPTGFDNLDVNWGVCEKVAHDHGRTVERKRWRVVASMHLAETREQAWRDMEHGVLALAGYMEGLGGRKLPWSETAGTALDWWTTTGLPVFGVATIGTPDDAIATIRALSEKTDGFGTFLFLAQNCAPWEATKRSYELFAENVIPALRGANANREASIQWAGANSERFMGAMQQAILEAIARYSPAPAGDGDGDPRATS
jgi:limonene 1,2-monooxygenase